MKKKMILAAGTGYLGNVLVNRFKDEYDIVILTRSRRENTEGIKYVEWDAATIGDWTRQLEGADVLVNLTGKSVDCRFTEENKRLILSSRVDSTKALGEAISKCENPPALWINSSSASNYDHSGSSPNDENAPALGSGFMADVTKTWEEVFFSFDLPKTRQVAARITVVLGKNGGAAKPLVRLAKFFMGGKQGSGKQKFSWIHEDDFANAIAKIIETPAIEGPVNMAAPQPVSNIKLMKAIRQAVNRPFGIPSPKWVLEIGAFLIRTETELMLSSMYVIPGKLSANGFNFSYPTVEAAMDEIVS